MTCQLGPGLAATTPPPIALVPFISQIATEPSSFCHTRSDGPLPNQSPVPLRCQLGPGLPILAVPVTVAPFISQIAALPSSFCHRMSEVPSLLKSPTPATCQLGPGLPTMP